MDTERKTQTVTVKVSATEREVIMWGARLVGETPSTFARSAATDRAIAAIANQCERAQTK